jgi:regulator of RNase E activity RraA
MSDCLNSAGAAKEVGAGAPAPPATTVSAATIAKLRKLDCPTVFNAVHQLTPKDNATGDQWRDANMLDPTYMYTGPSINAVSPIVARSDADGGGGGGETTDTAAIGYAVCIEVTTNDPDSAEAMGWQEYYTRLQAMEGPIIAVLKDVDQSFPGRSAVFGDGMSNLHKACGVSGAVCDGVVRDVDGIKRVGFPVWATGEVSGHGRFVVKSYNVPVTVGGLRVTPGDLLMCDSGGVVRIPHAIADHVAERAENIRGKEAAVFAWFQSDEFDASKLDATGAALGAAYDKEHPESF